MRGKVTLFLLINVIVIGLLLRSVWTLLSLLVVDGSNDAILPAELPAPNSKAVDEVPQLIPRIIHQTYANDTIPEVWKQAQTSCLSLHKTWEYKLWTDASAREFIQNEYPHFLDTWDGYQHNIQRADAIRYFVLAKEGGVYVDLDDGCNRRLEPLMAYPAWVRRTTPTGISNDVMGAVPGHPFFLKVIDSLPKYNRNWISPYITIMGSTGPLFLSLIWRHYNNVDEMPANERVRIIFPDEYMGHSWSFFLHHVGNSWHKWDTKLILWMSNHWIEITVLGFAIAAVGFFFAWIGYRRAFISNHHGRSRSRSPFFFFRRIPWWRNNRYKDYIELRNTNEASD